MNRNDLSDLISKIEPSDKTIQNEVLERFNNMAKPIKGLGEFENLIAKLAAIQGSANVDISKKCVIVMCADNGVVKEGVTQTDSSVTAVVTRNFARKTTSVNILSSYTHADVIPVDIGVIEDFSEEGIVDKKVAKGTKSFLDEAAMSEEELMQAISAGIDMVKDAVQKGYKIIGTGEMGIGNTTTSSALASVLLGLEVEKVTGAGAGLSKEGIQRKIEVIKLGIKKHSPFTDPLDMLKKLGGFDIAGICGMFLGGAIYKIPIVIDGLISSVAALIAYRLNPKTADYMIASHISKEPGSLKIMEELGLRPMIDASLGLGEGTGTAMLFPLIDMVNNVYRKSESFDEIGIEAYEPMGE